MQKKNKILILFAHPALHKSRINRKLVDGLTELEGITFHNLYESYPDFHLDIGREQQLLLDHNIIVWHHPFYWYSAPAMVKEWMDLVLEHGFAYGSKGKALQGKMIFNAITTGGRREAYMEGGYNNYTIRQLLFPFRQTANLCKMIYLPPFVVHGTHLLNDKEIMQYRDDYRSILISLRDSIFTQQDLAEYDYLNDILQFNDK